MQRAQAVDARGLDDLPSDGVGEQSRELVREAPDRCAMGLHPHGVYYRDRTAAVGELPDRPGQIVVIFEVEHVDTV